MATLVLLAAVVAAAVSHRVPSAVVGGALVCLLAGLRILPVARAFAGFGSELVLLVGGMMVVAAGLTRTGAADRLVAGVEVAAGRPDGVLAERRLLGGLVLAGAATAALLGDVPAMAVWLPAVSRIARRHGTTPGRLLLPILFGVLAGSEVTLIGTAGNILASGILTAVPGQVGFGVFTQAPVGLVAVAAVFALAVTVGPALLPAKHPGEPADVDFANLKMYQGEVAVAAHSALDGRRLREAAVLRELGLRVTAIFPGADAPGRRGLPLPGSSPPATAGPDSVVRAGDRLLVQGSAEDLLEAQNSGLFELRGPAEAATVTAEALVVPESGLVGRTLTELGFRQRYGLDVLAVWRHRGQPLTRLQHLRLRPGDILLLSGSRLAALRLHERLDALLLGERDAAPPRRDRAAVALGLLAAFVAVAATRLMDPAAAAVGAAAGMVLTGCLRPEEALAALDLPILLLLAGIVPLGTALQATPVPALVAAGLAPLARADGPLAVWAVLFLVAALTTQLLSDVATVLLWVPVALRSAALLHADSRPLALAVMLGAQAPVVALGHKVALLVPSAGRYSNRDFLRYGLPAAALLLGAGLWAAPRVFPFR